MSTLSPFVERTLSCEHLPLHFVKSVEQELRSQLHEQKTNKKKRIQVDLNEIYGWKRMPPSLHAVIHTMITDTDRCNPVLENDIQTNNLTFLLKQASEEYLYQKKQVKLGKRKHISVDYNILYC
jgi:hypothetical protein